MLKDLHDTHPGVSCMKSLGSMFVWWPGFDKHLEKLVWGCYECQGFRPAPSVALLHLGLGRHGLGQGYIVIMQVLFSSLPGSH